jgi:hypothetical protein
VDCNEYILVANMADDIGPTFRLVQGGTVRTVLNIDELQTWQMRLDPPFRLVQGGTVRTALNIDKLQTWRMILDPPLD